MSEQDEEARAMRAARGGSEKSEYVRRTFSEIAPRYDLLNHLLSLNIDKGWRRKAIAELHLTRNPRGRYLDLCAGTLDVSQMLGSTSGFHGSVVAADFAEPMLRAGVSKVSGLSVSPVTADALNLPIESSSMSGAIV